MNLDRIARMKFFLLVIFLVFLVGLIGCSKKLSTRAKSAKVTDPSPIAIVALHDAHSLLCARLRDGSLNCIGQLSLIRYKNGKPVVRLHKEQTKPIRIDGLERIIQLDGDSNRRCAIVEGGDLYCWGSIKPPDDVLAWYQSVPTLMAKQAAHVAVMSHACYVDELGSVFCWGANSCGEVGTTPRWRSPRTKVPVPKASQVAVGLDFSCALAQAGDVYCWGSFELEDVPLEPSRCVANQAVRKIAIDQVAQISASDYSVCVRRKDGSVWCWGNNSLGSMGIGKRNEYFQNPQRVSVPIAVDLQSDNRSACVRTREGHIYCWGYFMRKRAKEIGQTHWMPQKIPDLIAVDLTVGNSYACALRVDGSVYCFGHRADMARRHLDKTHPADGFALREATASWLTVPMAQARADSDRLGLSKSMRSVAYDAGATVAYYCKKQGCDQWPSFDPERLSQGTTIYPTWLMMRNAHKTSARIMGEELIITTDNPRSKTAIQVRCKKEKKWNEWQVDCSVPKKIARP